MRASILAALVVAAVVTSAMAQDQSRPADAPRPPFDPLEKARKGDWVATRATWSTGDTKRVQACVSVISSDSNDDAWKIRVSASNGGGGFVFYPKEETPTLAKLLGEPRSVKLDNVKTRDEKKKVGATEFDATLVSFTRTEGDRRDECQLWLSRDVKVDGILAYESKTVRAKPEEAGSMRLEVTGYGNEDKSLWGLTRAGAEEAVTEAAAENLRLRLDEKVTARSDDVALDSAFTMVLGDRSAEFGAGVDTETKVSFAANDEKKGDVLKRIVEKAGYVLEQKDGVLVVKTRAK